jgi:ParB-like chromosome segregation protein Spo0J
VDCEITAFRVDFCNNRLWRRRLSLLTLLLVPPESKRAQRKTRMSCNETDVPTDRLDVIAKSQGTLADRRIEMVPVTRLPASKGNARTHSTKQIRKIADSIKRFGFNNPVLVDDGGTVIAGHGRVEAAKLLGINEVPTLRLSHLSATEQRAYVLADNRLAEKAGWDREVLAVELKALIDLDFEVELTGFDTGEINIILDRAEQPESEPAGHEVPEAGSAPSVSQAGDLWLLGAHQLWCGEAHDKSIDAAIRRWQAGTGKTATLAATGQSFEEIAEKRARSKARPTEIDQRDVVAIEEAR